MLSIITLGGLGLTTSLMAGGASLAMGGANLAMGAAGLGLGAANLAGKGVLGTVKLAKDSIQSIGLGSGGSQARKRMMERGLIESGVKRTKQLKQMAGRAAGMLGVNLSLASLLKQSQIFTGVFGTVFQILGAFIDVMLIPLMPTIKWMLNGLIDFLPHIQAKADSFDKYNKMIQNFIVTTWNNLKAYFSDIMAKSDGWWGSGGFFATLIKDIFYEHIKPWWHDHAWPAIEGFLRMIAEKAGWLTAADNELSRMAAAFGRKQTGAYFKRESLPQFEPGSGQRDEFDEHGIPEGYKGGPGAAGPGMFDIPTPHESFESMERNIEAAMGNILKQPAQWASEINPFKSDLPIIQSEAEKNLEALENAVQREMMHTATNQALKDYLGLMGTTGSIWGIGQVVQSGNGVTPLPPKNPPITDFSEMITLGAVAGARNRAAAEAVVKTVNEVYKENVRAEYADERAAYEDEIYFQEMMMGFGRG